MLTNIYFVRHAHSVYTPDEMGRPLSKQGMADAARITQLLEKENINRVISSPYKRAIQTVEGTAKLIGREVEIMDSFKERKLSEKTLEDFQFAITKVWKMSIFLGKGESPIPLHGRGALKQLSRF